MIGPGKRLQTDGLRGILNHMANYYVADDSKTDAVFHALANERRRRIVLDLCESPVTVSVLAAQHKLSLPAIHKHLRILEDAHLLSRHKIGRVNFVALNRQGISILQSWTGSPILKKRKNSSLELFIAKYLHEK